MKKRLMLLFSVICVLCCALAFAACGGTESAPPHEHTFTQAWSGDGTYHWHAATCGHTDEVSGYGEHSWDDGVCTVCKYVGGVEALEYTLNSSGDSYSVTGVGHCGVAELTIPSVYNGLPVTSIGDHAFSLCAQLESVVIPDSVASIGDYAFYGCTALEELVYDAAECADLSAYNYVFYNAGKGGALRHDRCERHARPQLSLSSLQRFLLYAQARACSVYAGQCMHTNRRRGVLWLHAAYGNRATCKHRAARA